MAEYQHTQSVSDSIWVIAHNLNVTETVNDVLIDDNGSLSKVLPSYVRHTNDNTLTIGFSVPQTGIARIIG